MEIKEIVVRDITIGNSHPLFFIAGPCVIEDEASTLRTAERLIEISTKLKINLIFKASYDKANRSSIKSFRGPGIERGLKILQKVRESTGLPVLSDVHSVEEIKTASDVLDIIQVPAFLCRQTDMILESSRTGKPVNIKKGQFISPYEVKNIIEKFTSTGNQNLMITERGYTFGYNNLVVDMRAIPIVREFGFPVIFDATHSVQLPGGSGSASSGQREFVEPLSKAAVSAGCDGIFMEVHEDPDRALCDGPNMISIDRFALLAEKLSKLGEFMRVL